MEPWLQVYNNAMGINGISFTPTQGFGNNLTNGFTNASLSGATDMAAGAATGMPIGMIISAAQGILSGIGSGLTNYANNSYSNKTDAITADAVLNGSDESMEAVKSNINSGIADFSNVKNVNNLANSWSDSLLQSEIAAPTTGEKMANWWGETFENMSNPLGGSIKNSLHFLSNPFGLFGDEDDRAAEINKQIRRANKITEDSFQNAARNITMRNNRNAFMNQFDNGGSLDGLNGVTEFNVGDTHENNPYGGIQQGIASDGLPNTVEEGEVKYKDYIYSARLKPSKSLLKEFNLSDKYAGKTFAEVADILQKESKDRPNDPISLQTLDDWMNRLAGAQEEYKAKAEQRRLAKAIDSMSDEEKAAIMSSLVQSIPQQEDIDLGQPMYASGGKIHIKPENRGKFTALKKRTGKSATWFKQHGTPAQKKMATFALNSRKWKHEDGGHLAAFGMNLDIPPYLQNLIEPEEHEQLNLNVVPTNDSLYVRTLPEVSVTPANRLTAPFGLPWEVGYIYGNDIYNNGYTKPIINPSISTRAINIPDGDTSTIHYDVQEVENPYNTFGRTSTKSVESENTKNINFNPEYLRYAPVLGSAEAMLRSALQPKDFTVGNEYRQLSSQLRPIAAPHVGGYRRYNPYDINLGDIENIALTANALAANRGQNRATQGALNAAVINAAQKTAAARNLAAQQANESNRLAVDTYNLGIDQFNANRDTQYDQLNQQILQNKLNMLMSAAQADDASKEAWANMYNTTRENFFNQLGNVGKDTWNRNQRDWLLNALGREGLLELLKSGYKLG